MTPSSKSTPHEHLFDLNGDARLLAEVEIWRLIDGPYVVAAKDGDIQEFSFGLPGAFRNFGAAVMDLLYSGILEEAEDEGGEVRKKQREWIKKLHLYNLLPPKPAHPVKETP